MQEELDRLTPEEMERLDRAEQEALAILNRRMREGRWYPRRHMRFAFFVIATIFALGAIAWFIGWLVANAQR